MTHTNDNFLDQGERYIAGLDRDMQRFGRGLILIVAGAVLVITAAYFWFAYGPR